MSTLAQRLQQALDLKGAKPADLARACKVKAPSVTAWFNGETKQLKAGSLLLAAEFLGVRAEWLRSGTPPMRAQEQTPGATRLVAAEPPPSARLPSLEQDLLLAFRDLPSHKQRELVAEVMRDAEQWRKYTAEVLAKHGVKRVVDDSHVAKHLPPAPRSNEDTQPGDLDPLSGSQHQTSE